MASSLSEKKIYITDRRYQDRPNSCRPSLRSLPPVSAPSPDDDGGDDDDGGGDDDGGDDDEDDFSSKSILISTFMIC